LGRCHLRTCQGSRFLGGVALATRCPAATPGRIPVGLSPSVYDAVRCRRGGSPRGPGVGVHGRSSARPQQAPQLGQQQRPLQDMAAIEGPGPKPPRYPPPPPSPLSPSLPRAFSLSRSSLPPVFLSLSRAPVFPLLGDETETTRMRLGHDLPRRQRYWSNDDCRIKLVKYEGNGRRIEAYQRR
jgi:hypothetical protein